MLDHLKRFFNATEKEPEMAQEGKQAPALVVDNTAELASAQVALASQTEAFSDLQAKLAELSSKFEQAQLALAENEAAKAALQAEQLAVKMQSRKEKVESLIGTVKAPALLSATESLDDITFETIVTAMQGAVEKEGKSELFTEMGASVETEADIESPIAKALKARLTKQSQ